MTVLVLTVLALLVWGVVSDREGPLWRWLVGAPARRLNALRPRDVIALVLFLAIGPLLVEMAMPGLAMVLAVDLAAWIEVSVAVLVVSRVSGWKSLPAGLGQISRRAVQATRGVVRRLAVRARRAPSRRPGPGPRSQPRPRPDDEPGAWAFA
jgi:hypothetical protein